MFYLGNFTIVSEVSNALLNLLRDNMMPEPIQNPDHIGICAPYDKGDIILGIYLYDLKESEEIRTTSMVHVNQSTQQYPPMYLSLYYMVTAYSNTDVKFRQLDDHRIIGRVLQIFNNNPIIDGKKLGIANNALISDMSISFINLTTEEKSRIWTFPNLPYRLSLFYKVAPVEIESTRIRSAQRVTVASFEAKE